jgi:hypothetical protein
MSSDRRSVSVALRNGRTAGQTRTSGAEMASKCDARGAEGCDVAFSYVFGEGIYASRRVDGLPIWEISECDHGLLIHPSWADMNRSW